jgi:hypothetical protein
MVARLRRDLGERSLTVMQSLCRVRLLTTLQIQRLHFSDLSATTQPRRTRALLHRLTEQRLLVRLPRAIGGIRAGSKGHVFALSGLGQAVLDCPGPGKRRRTVWQTKPYFQDHMLAVAELFVELTEVCRDVPAELLDFDAEPTCWRRFTGIGGQSLVLKPDAFVRVAVDDYELSSFIEVDLGTESLPTIQRKAQAFTQYWRSGLEQQRHGVFPRVLWLAPTDHRLSAMTGALERAARGSASALFSIALLHDGAHVLTTIDDTDGGQP